MRSVHFTVRAAIVLLAFVAAGVQDPAALRAQPPVPGESRVLDGPSGAIRSLSGMAIARDGSGAVVYLKTISGTPRVFVSRLVAGVFQTPEQVDAQLQGASSQPVLAAGNGGLLLIGFINGGDLYVVDRPSATGPYAAPTDLYPQASNPSLQMTALGKAYLAFTAADGSGGHDVRTAYYFGGQWALEGAPLNATPADDAGTGSGRPRVAAAGDGVAIVVWGEAGHIYSRRVWGTAPSAVFQQADVGSMSGWQEIRADEPVVGAGGDSSYADVVFHELLANGAATQSRVLLRRLRGSQYEGIVAPDGLSTPGAEGADDPQVAVTEYGRGFATSARQSTRQLVADTLAQNGASVGPSRVDTLQNASPPYGLPAAAGLFSMLIAWQHDPGLLGKPDIRVRYALDGSDLGPEIVLSDPGLGATDAASGLAAAGDFDGDAAVAWIQGTANARAVLAAQLYKPPGGFGARPAFRYSRTPQPALAWSAAHDSWGPVTYAVSVDGLPIGQTSGTMLAVPAALSDGPHSWQVVATNPAGLQSQTRVATVFVDTVAPTVGFTLSGDPRVDSPLRLVASYDDPAPAPLPPTAASGVANASVSWGDGTLDTIEHRGARHTYLHPGAYVLALTVADRAGNTTVVVRRLTIKPLRARGATHRR